jgi:DDE family transposase
LREFEKTQTEAALFMTECNQQSFGFEGHFSRQVTAEFDGGQQTSDGGGLLLREADRRLNLLSWFAACFVDGRDPERTDHTVDEMVSQRAYGIALGYEDLNDHEQLRHDPLLAMMAGRKDPETALAGKSTLNRLELSTKKPDRYKRILCHGEAVDRLMVDVFIESHTTTPAQIVLDLDSTDFAIHGRQEGRFFHGFYDQYCYLPLYIFCGTQLLGVRLRQSNIDGAAGSLKEVQRIVGQIREHWSGVQIVLRADSGFCRDELMSWCEGNRVDFVFGLARNSRLETLLRPQLEQAAAEFAQTQQRTRIFTEFEYSTLDSWSRSRRVVAKAEHIEGKANPRFIVTSLTATEWLPQQLYEDFYCARGDMENRIKEQLSLFADRVSAETMQANQLRIYFSAIAYLLVDGLRRLALTGTEMAHAQVQTIRLRLLKIGAQFRITVRRIWISLAASYPHQQLFRLAWAALRG